MRDEQEEKRKQKLEQQKMFHQSSNIKPNSGSSNEELTADEISILREKERVFFYFIKKIIIFNF